MRKKTLILAGMQILALAVFALVLDRVLGWFGLPSEAPVKVAHPPNYVKTERNLDFQYTFATNSQGYRYREIPLAKPAGTFRVIMLGDSYVEGFGVEASQSYCSRLERRFNTPFINAGLAGTEPLVYGRTLFHVGVRYDPDAVLICVYANDLSNTDGADVPQDIYPESATRYGWRRIVHALWPRTFVMLKQLRMRYRNRAQSGGGFLEPVMNEARRLRIPEARIAEWKAGIPATLLDAAGRGELNGVQLSTGLLRPNFWTDSLDVDSPLALRKWKAMSAILTEIVKGSERRGMRVGVVFIPSVFQYSPVIHDDQGRAHPWRLSGVKIRREWLTMDTRIQELLQTWSAGLKTPYFDLTPALRRAAADGAQLNWRYDDHWTPLGHDVAAQAIGDWISRECVFPIGEKCAAARP